MITVSLSLVIVINLWTKLYQYVCLGKRMVDIGFCTTIQNFTFSVSVHYSVCSTRSGNSPVLSTACFPVPSRELAEWAFSWYFCCYCWVTRFVIFPVTLSLLRKANQKKNQPYLFTSSWESNKRAGRWFLKIVLQNLGKMPSVQYRAPKWWDNELLLFYPFKQKGNKHPISSCQGTPIREWQFQGSFFNNSH